MLKRTFMAMAFVTALTVLPAGANYAYAKPAKPANELSVKAVITLDEKAKGTIEYQRNLFDNLAITSGVSVDTKGGVEGGIGVKIYW